MCFVVNCTGPSGTTRPRVDKGKRPVVQNRTNDVDNGARKRLYDPRDRSGGSNAEAVTALQVAQDEELAEDLQLQEVHDVHDVAEGTSQTSNHNMTHTLKFNSNA